jgi:hypothetical protein
MHREAVAMHDRDRDPPPGILTYPGRIEEAAQRVFSQRHASNADVAALSRAIREETEAQNRRFEALLDRLRNPAA